MGNKINVPRDFWEEAKSIVSKLKINNGHKSLNDCMAEAYIMGISHCVSANKEILESKKGGDK